MRATFLGSTLALAMFTACAPVGPPATVPGPEAADLAPRVSGVVLLPAHVGGITAISLPSGKRTTVVKPAGSGGPEQGTTHALCGPDQQGRVVVINDFSETERHEVNVWSLAGQHLVTLINRPGQALWHHYIGESMALTRTRGRLAILSKIVEPSETNPFAEPRGYALEVWNLDTGQGRKTGIVAQDRGLCWMPDGARLLYVEHVPSNQVGTMGGGAFGQSFHGRDQVPVVCLVDLKTMATRRLHAGQGPVASADGKTVIVTDYDGNSRRVDLASGQARPVHVPGQWAALMAMLPGDLALYPALPTTGTKPRVTSNNSPLVGPKYMRTIKVAELGTGRFQTVADGIDPRDQPSFGQPASVP